MYIYVHVHLHTHVCVHVYTYTYIYIHVYVDMCSLYTSTGPQGKAEFDAQVQDLHTQLGGCQKDIERAGEQQLEIHL